MFRSRSCPPAARLFPSSFRRQLHLEWLEARAVPAVLYVDSNLAAGASLTTSPADLGGRVTLDRDSSGTLTAGDQVTVALGQTGQTAKLTYGEAPVGGDVGSAYGTIQAALAAAATGDVIKIAAGTYDESVTVSTQVTLEGLTGTATDVVIHPTSGAAITAAVSGVTIQDLRVTGGTSGVAVTAGGITNLTLTDVQADANTGAGVDLASVGGTITLTGVKTTGNGAAGLQLSGVAGSTLTLTSLTDTSNTGAGLTLTGFATVNLTDLTLTGNGGTNTLTTAASGTVNFTAATTGTTPYAITAGATQLQVTRDPAGANVASQAITLSGETTLSLTGGAGADTFTVTPAATGGPAISVTGGLPGPTAGMGTAGDVLDLTGVTGPTVTSSFAAATGFGGTVSASGIANLAFAGIESLANGATISGTVFTDANGNEHEDGSEIGLAGVTVQLSVNGSGAADLTTTTDASGHYSFTGLPPGTYQVRVSLASGQSLTTPLPAPVTTTLGQTVSNINFGVQGATSAAGGTVTGVVFADANGNGVLDSGETVLGGVTVFLDLNGNGQLNAGEPSVVTSATGAFTLTSSTSGLYTVRAVSPAGYATGVIPTVDLTGGNTLTANVGLRPVTTAAGGTVTGEVFADTNRNGTLDGGESGVAGVTVYLDANGNGRLDPGEVSATTNASGTFTLTSTTNGLFMVRAVAPSGFTASTAPVVDLSGGATVTADVGLLAPATSGGTITGVVFDDKNRNGVLNHGEHPVGGVTVFLDLNGNGRLDQGEPATVSNEDGEYALTTTTDGQVTVDAVLPVGYLHLSSTPTATLTGGNTVTGADVGLYSKLPPQAEPAELLAVGVIEGGKAHVKLFDQTGKLTQDLDVSAFAGGAEPRVAVADVTGDGVPDVIVGTGVGVANAVEVLDGTTLKAVFTTHPFEAGFTGGVFVAAGDVTGDGVADVIVTPDEGGGPRVVVYRGGDFAQVASFFGIEDPNFRGGARASIADMNGDGIPDLIIAAGFGGGPRVAFFDGSSIVGGGGLKHLFNDIFVFEQTLRNGVFVTAGDVDGDGYADLIVGGGPGGGPRVMVLSGASLAGGNLTSPTMLANFFAGDTNNRGGVRVAVKDLSGDGQPDLVVGDGDGAGTHVTGYSAKSLKGGNPNKVYDFDAESGATGGVFVG